jgi:hypothetical protein
MKEENKVINGVSAELLSASITYPLNTIKTNTTPLVYTQTYRPVNK